VSITVDEIKTKNFERQKKYEKIIAEKKLEEVIHVK